MTCTYVDCPAEACHELKSQDGSVWSNLCDEHNSKLDEAIRAGDPKVVVALWVGAQGGPERAAERMSRDFEGLVLHPLKHRSTEALKKLVTGPLTSGEPTPEMRGSVSFDLEPDILKLLKDFK